MLCDRLLDVLVGRGAPLQLLGGHVVLIYAKVLPDCPLVVGPRAARLPVDAGLSLGERSRSMPDNSKGGPGVAAVPPGGSSGRRAWAAGARPWRTRRSAEEAGERHLLLGSRSCLAARRRVVKLPPEPLRPPPLPRAQPLALHGGLPATALALHEGGCAVVPV
jgi:hypothetical protein